MKRLAFKKTATPKIEFDLDVSPMIFRSLIIFVRSENIDNQGVKGILEDLNLGVPIECPEEEEVDCSLYVKLTEKKMTPNWFFTYVKNPIKIFQNMPEALTIFQKLNSLPSDFQITFLLKEDA